MSDDALTETERRDQEAVSMSKRDMEKDGGPAFAHGNREHGGDPGMSLRDWFAGQALTALGDVQFPDAGRRAAPKVAALAYEVADAMLKARANGDTP